MRPYGNPIPLPEPRERGFNISERIAPLATSSLGSFVSTFAALLDTVAFSGRDSRPLKRDEGVEHALAVLRRAATQQSSVFLLGNGGSSAVASHIANDFCNTSGLRAFTLSDQAMLTCFTNDYGYANAYGMLLTRLARSNDVLIAISSSGSSSNIVNAIQKMLALGGHVITLTGFSEDNPVRRLGEVNAWLDSKEYGLVETGHLLIMHYLADCLSLERARSGDTTKVR